MKNTYANTHTGCGQKVAPLAFLAVWLGITFAAPVYQQLGQICLKTRKRCFWLYCYFFKKDEKKDVKKKEESSEEEESDEEEESSEEEEKKEEKKPAAKPEAKKVTSDRVRLLIYVERFLKLVVWRIDWTKRKH